MVMQLSLLGYVLVPIFTFDKWWLVLLYGVFMLMIASLEAVQRPSYTFQGVLANTVAAMAASSGLLLSYLVLVVLALRPVWEAQYIIPLLGMLLGNATSAVSVGLSTVLEDLAANRAVIEQLLALGANRFEATDEAVRRALKVSMTPLLNQMSVMGIVSIPGMMTGQILAGGDPTQAARYQMVIMFIITAATCVASVSSIYLAVLHVVDATHTFRADRLVRKQPRGGGAGGAFADAVTAARRRWAAARRKGAALGSCLAAACCCCLCPPPPAPRRRSRAAGAGDIGDADGGTTAAPLLQPPNGGDDGGNGNVGTAASGREAAAAPAAAARDATRTGAGSGSSPYATDTSRQWSMWSSAAAAAGRLWPGRRGGAAAACSTHGTAQPNGTPARRDRLFSAESTLSGAAAADGGGGDATVTGVPSPLSARSGTAPGSSATPKLSWEERSLGREEDASVRGGGGVYDAEEGAGPGPGSGSGAPAEELQPLLGPGPTALQDRGGSGPEGPSTSLVGGSVSTVVAVGGWLGSAASAGWGAAWGALGRWRSGGGTAGAGQGSGQGAEREAGAALRAVPGDTPA